MKSPKSRLRQHYQEGVCPKLKAEFSLANPWSLPRLNKVVVNVGAGEMAKNKELATSLVRDLSTITGQKPSVRKARVSIASFSLRQGMPVGLKVTLRGERMYAFLDRLIGVVLPRLRDFRGLSPKGIDLSGNYTLGLTEHTIFPEIDITKSGKPFGMEITLVGDLRGNLKLAKRFWELMGLPFEK